MLRSDSRRQEFNPDMIIGNNDTKNNDMISEIEKELHDNPYDMISLVFLLYDVPITALQRLIVFERVSKDIGYSTNPNMLHEWFQHAKHTPTWKHEFIEALLLCQLYSIARKLGLHVPTARNHYQTDNSQATMYINPVKKALYKLCENMNADNLVTLKKALVTYNIDTSDYDSCELVLLKLMCEKFITVNQFQYNKKAYGFHVELDNLLRIIGSLPGLRQCAQDIKILQKSINEDSKPRPVIASTPSPSMKVDESNQGTQNSHFFNKDFEEAFGMISALSLEDDNNITLKSDKTKLENDSFEIKSYKRVGVCVILNQIEFYPSKNSIENNQTNTLAKRNGSDKDQTTIERTMKALNFSVYSAKNLTHREIDHYLKEILKTKVSENDSVFMLCFLSHGVKGHVYAADSVKVNMDDIQKLLDSDIAVHLHGKPKLLIIQACQIDETPITTRLVADSPGNNYALKKTNFLIYWATAPELEAYRDEGQGSIFIQRLCTIIREYANREHICDIFTKVTDNVTLICEQLGCKQVPIYHSTLRKKLYLKMPQ